MSYLNCIHALPGLCPGCQASYEEDPGAWIEFGDHPEGIARWEALQAEMAAYHAANPQTDVHDDSDIPF